VILGNHPIHPISTLVKSFFLLTVAAFTVHDAFAQNSKTKQTAPQKKTKSVSVNPLKQALNSIVKIDFLKSHTIGTGFFLDNQGTVVTNAHVMSALMKDGEEPELSLADGTKFKIESIGSCQIAAGTNDLCFFKSSLKHSHWIEFSEVEASGGDRFTTIGHPRGFEFSFAEGLISNIRKKDDPIMQKLSERNGGAPTSAMIQLSAPINPGNSGGPVLSSDGKLWGIVTWSLNNLGADGINFAIPSSQVKVRYAESLKSFQDINRFKKVSKTEVLNKVTDLYKERYFSFWRNNFSSNDPSTEIAEASKNSKSALAVKIKIHGNHEASNKKFEIKLSLPLINEFLELDNLYSDEQALKRVETNNTIKQIHENIRDIYQISYFSPHTETEYQWQVREYKIRSKKDVETLTKATQEKLVQSIPLYFRPLFSSQNELRINRYIDIGHETPEYFYILSILAQTSINNFRDQSKKDPPLLEAQVKLAEQVLLSAQLELSSEDLPKPTVQPVVAQSQSRTPASTPARAPAAQKISSWQAKNFALLHQSKVQWRCSTDDSQCPTFKPSVSNYRGKDMIKIFHSGESRVVFPTTCTVVYESSAAIGAHCNQHTVNIEVASIQDPQKRATLWIDDQSWKLLKLVK